MPAPRRHKLSAAQIGAALGVSRQGAADLIRRHGYALASDPEALWQHLLERDRAGQLRYRLSDPAFRAAAAQQLSTLAKP